EKAKADYDKTMAGADEKRKADIERNRRDVRADYDIARRGQLQDINSEIEQLEKELHEAVKKARDEAENKDLLPHGIFRIDKAVTETITGERARGTFHASIAPQLLQSGPMGRIADGTKKIGEKMDEILEAVKMVGNKAFAFQ